MKLYAIRHGQTDWNAKDKIQGRNDISLNDVGKSQAVKSAKMFGSNKKIDVIISSPLTRAKETARIIAEQLELEILIADSLIERDFGDYEGKGFDEIDCSIKELRRYTDNLPISKGETIREVAERVFTFLDETIATFKGENILLVTHGHVLRTIFWYFNGIPKNGEEQDIITENCFVYEYDIAE